METVLSQSDTVQQIAARQVLMGVLMRTRVLTRHKMRKNVAFRSRFSAAKSSKITSPDALPSRVNWFRSGLDLPVFAWVIS